MTYEDLLHQVFMAPLTGELFIGKPLLAIDMIDRETGVMRAGPEVTGYAIYQDDECLALWTREQVDMLPMVKLGAL